MKWTPNIPEEKDLQPPRAYARFLLGGVTGFLLTYGPFLIRESNPAGIACVIFGVLGAGFLVVLKQLYGLRILIPGVIGVIAGVFFTLSFLVDAYFAPPALVALAAGIWAIMEETKASHGGDKDTSNPGGTEH
jgi:membrane associated rhomboid family serine protease